MLFSAISIINKRWVNDKGCNLVKRSALRDGFLKAASWSSRRPLVSAHSYARETRNAKGESFGTERELIKILNIRLVILFGALFIRLRRTGKPRCATLHACPHYVRSIGKSSLLAFHFEILICMMSACANEAQASICDSRCQHRQRYRFIFLWGFSRDSIAGKCDERNVRKHARFTSLFFAPFTFLLCAKSKFLLQCHLRLFASRVFIHDPPIPV